MARRSQRPAVAAARAAHCGAGNARDSSRCGHGDGAPDPSLAGAANYIRVLHDDGSMALYGHLREAGVFVRAGDRVTLCQVIGESGNTGFSSGPHLHFVVQVNAGMRLESVPFRMIGPDGYLPLGR